MSHEYILTLHCPDQPGILAAVTAALVAQDGDVRDAQSFGDDSTGEFFIRMHLLLPTSQGVAAFRQSVDELAERLGIRWALHDCARRSQVLILVSKFDHCLLDLLHRWKAGSLKMDLPVVISNHPDVADVVRWHGIEFEHLPVTASTKRQQERQILDRIEQHAIDLVVLARYMQILSPELVQSLSERCINIHHSFLPSFKGALPYRQAHDRGVKLIGATAHYVTEDLDEGPIIEQDVRRVNHAITAAEMTAIGREIESSVLARAVRWHLEHRVLMNGSKTVVFS